MPGHKQSLGHSALSGGIATLASRVGCTLANLIGLYFLARMVLPADFGLVAKVTAAVGIVSVFGDFGLTVATIQSKEISRDQLSALLWVNLLVAIGLAFVVCFCSPLVAAFYEDTRVIGVCLFLALNILITGIGIQHLALLTREMKFRTIGLIEVSSVVFGIGCALTAAFQDLGYWCLLIQVVSASLLKTASFWIFSGFMPRAVLRGTGVRKMLKVGGNFTASTFINYLSRNGDNILIGKVCGEAALGYYSRAYSLLLMPMTQMVTPISRVAVPALSRLQFDPRRYREFFRNGVSLALALQIPVAVFAAVAGEEIVLTLLGPAWKESIPIFYALTPNLLLATTASATQWVYLSRGDTARLLKNVIANSTVILFAFAIGVSYGAIGVAVAYSIATCLVRIPTILYCFRPSPVGPKDFFPFMITPFLLSGVAAGIAVWSSWIISPHLAPVGLALKLVIFFSVYIGLLQLTSVGRDLRSRFAGLLRPYLTYRQSAT